MDKISVNNLFNLRDDFQPLNVNNLCVNSLSKNKQRKTELNFQKMIDARKEKDAKVVTQYDKIFNICLNKINIANTHNRTQIIYEVPESVYGYSNYNIADCILYVVNKLEAMNIDVIILKTTIYISWEGYFNK